MRALGTTDGSDLPLLTLTTDVPVLTHPDHGLCTLIPATLLSAIQGAVSSSIRSHVHAQTAPLALLLYIMHLNLHQSTPLLPATHAHAATMCGKCPLVTRATVTPVPCLRSPAASMGHTRARHPICLPRECECGCWMLSDACVTVCVHAKICFQRQYRGA